MKCQRFDFKYSCKYTVYIYIPSKQLVIGKGYKFPNQSLE